MNTTTTPRHERARGTELPRGIGLPGRVVVSWATAGGILLGGLLVALMTLAGQLSGHGLFFTSSGLFVIGAIIGMLHGAVLGYLGRPTNEPARQARGELLRSALYAVPALAVGWLATVWVGMTVVALYLDRIVPLAGVGLAWVVGLTTVAAAAVYGWRALRNAYARWPERRMGTVLVATSFAALLMIFLADRPEIWGLRMRVTEVGAVLLAGLLALWVAGPAVTLALRLLRQLPTPRPRAVFGPHVGADVGTGLLVGAVLGLLAVPFAGPAVAAATGPVGAVVTSLGEAVVNEVLLRLVLMTSTIWLLLRWHRVHAEEAATMAVIGTALLQVLLYTPGVLAAGFPTTVGALGFLLVTALLPALAFGTLYWLRGFGAALVADATAVTAIALLAL